MKKLMHTLQRKSVPVEVSDKRKPEILWALKDISFSIEQGEIIGIIGRNGAGKSTLLKILSRIVAPTSGSVKIEGRTGSLLEVGTGFHPELTGRENIFLNGAILGMTQREVSRNFDDIVEFSEIARFIDTPVKRYSSGMYTRLAFAVAAHLDTEILFVDEVLAVGDVAFQKRCLNKMNEISKGGRTVIFVSHNIGVISELCTSAVLLNHGHMIKKGNVSQVIDAYSKLQTVETGELVLKEDPKLPCSVLKIAIMNEEQKVTSNFDIRDSIIIVITYRVTSRLDCLQITTTLARNFVDIVHSFDTDNLEEIHPTAPGVYQTKYVIPRMFLKAGSYTVRITTGTPDRLLQCLDSVIHFEVEELSMSTNMRGYQVQRPGHIISPGRWYTQQIEEVEKV